MSRDEEIARTLKQHGERLRHLESLEPAGAILPDYPWCWLGRMGTQVIPTGVWTAIIWDAELNDPHAMHDLVVNPNRINATENGVYVVSTHIQWAYNPNSGIRILAIVANGAIAFRRFATTYYTTNDATAPDQSLTGQFNLNTGQYVEVYVYQGSGGNLSLNRLAWSYPIVTVAKVCEL